MQYVKTTLLGHAGFFINRNSQKGARRWTFKISFTEYFFFKGEREYFASVESEKKTKGLPCCLPGFFSFMTQVTP